MWREFISLPAAEIATTGWIVTAGEGMLRLIFNADQIHLGQHRQEAHHRHECPWTHEQSADLVLGAPPRSGTGHK